MHGETHVLLLIPASFQVSDTAHDIVILEQIAVVNDYLMGQIPTRFQMNLSDCVVLYLFHINASFDGIWKLSIIFIRFPLPPVINAVSKMRFASVGIDVVFICDDTDSTKCQFDFP